MKIDHRIESSFTLKLTLTEEEARALFAITAYGETQFLQFFYKGLGTSILEPHETGLKKLFEEIDKKLLPLLEKIDDANIAVEQVFNPVKSK